MYLKVYFILAHKNPSQIKDLIGMLDDNKSLFFIHLDKNVKIQEYQNLVLNTSSHFVKNRVRCSWGKYSLVQATLNAMNEVKDYMDSKYKYSDYHFIMLSGEDLPLKNNININNFLEENSKTSYLNYWSLPTKKWWNGGLFRFENLYFFEYKKNQKLNYYLNRIIKKGKVNFLLPINKFKKNFPDFTLFGASQWMILSKDLLEFVLNKSEENSKFNSVFKYVLAPDETYFATLILNYDKQKQFLIQNYATHLIVFNGVDASPKYLEIKDLKESNEGFLFARKFDININQSTIDFVKKNIAQ